MVYSIINFKWEAIEVEEVRVALGFQFISGRYALRPLEMNNEIPSHLSKIKFPVVSKKMRLKYIKEGLR
jgi:hypothetical protein